jgi:hypothetical protein
VSAPISSATPGGRLARHFIPALIFPFGRDHAFDAVQQVFLRHAVERRVGFGVSRGDERAIHRAFGTSSASGSSTSACFYFPIVRHRYLKLASPPFNRLRS